MKALWVRLKAGRGPGRGRVGGLVLVLLYLVPSTGTRDPTPSNKGRLLAGVIEGVSGAKFSTNVDVRVQKWCLVLSSVGM